MGTLDNCRLPLRHPFGICPGIGSGTADCESKPAPAGRGQPIPGTAKGNGRPATLSLVVCGNGYSSLARLGCNQRSSFWEGSLERWIRDLGSSHRFGKPAQHEREVARGKHRRFEPHTTSRLPDGHSKPSFTGCRGTIRGAVKGCWRQTSISMDGSSCFASSRPDSGRIQGSDLWHATVER